MEKMLRVGEILLVTGQESDQDSEKARDLDKKTTSQIILSTENWISQSIQFSPFLCPLSLSNKRLFLKSFLSLVLKSRTGLAHTAIFQNISNFQLGRRHINFLRETQRKQLCIFTKLSLISRIGKWRDNYQYKKGVIILTMILIQILGTLEHALSQRFTCIKGDSRTSRSLRLYFYLQDSAKVRLSGKL